MNQREADEGRMRTAAAATDQHGAQLHAHALHTVALSADCLSSSRTHHPEALIDDDRREEVLLSDEHRITRDMRVTQIASDC
jgi:hypothetical protein